MKWQTLRHNGVAFPPPYDYRGLTVRIKGKPFKLNPLQEEMLMAWVKKKDTPYVQDPVFQKNFLGDLILQFSDEWRDLSLADIELKPLHAIAEREKTANLSDAEKKKRAEERKQLRDELKAKYGVALIDGNEVEIGAYLVEPPGILMGRGNHPLRGKWKPRVEPTDVTLNLDDDAPVPAVDGGWKEIVHEHDSMWIASWWDELSKKRKYIWLAETSHLRQERDKEKYLKAQKLEGGLERVREKIEEGMRYENPRGRAAIARLEKPLRDQQRALEGKILAATQAGDKTGRQKAEDALALVKIEREALEKQKERVHHAEMQRRQIATVCYLIDKLAMRVGDEKDEDEADTVGASTLRVEHIHIAKDQLAFDFLGKDSVRWEKSLPITAREQALVRNLQDFMQGKLPSEQIFDRIDSTHVNRFLGDAMDGLTAKVFRTFHATTTVRDFLAQNSRFKADATTFEKEYAAKMANLQAAIQCNHKRTPPKNWEENLAKKARAAEKLSAAKPDLAKVQMQIPAREATLKRLLEQQKRFEKNAPRLLQQKQAALAKLKAKKTPPNPKDAAKLKKQIAAAEKTAAKAQKQVGARSKHLNERVEKARAALELAKRAPERVAREYRERVERAQRQSELAKRTRDYNLGTSLKNYIDPRVFKAWGDHVGYDWKRLYTKALQRKFAWVEQSRVKWESE